MRTFPASLTIAIALLSLQCISASAQSHPNWTVSGWVRTASTSNIHYSGAWAAYLSNAEFDGASNSGSSSNTAEGTGAWQRTWTPIDSMGADLTMPEYIYLTLNANIGFTVTGSMKAEVGTASKTFNGTGNGGAVVGADLNKMAMDGAWVEEAIGSFSGNGYSGATAVVTDGAPAP